MVLILNVMASMNAAAGGDRIRSRFSGRWICQRVNAKRVFVADEETVSVGANALQMQNETRTVEGDQAEEVEDYGYGQEEGVDADGFEAGC